MRLRAFYVASVLACCACGVRCERPIHKADTVCWFRQQNGHIYIYIRHTTHIQDEMKSKDQRPAINWIKIVGCETTIFGLMASKAARIFFFDFPIHKRIFISEYSTHRHTHTHTHIRTVTHFRRTQHAHRPSPIFQLHREHSFACENCIFGDAITIRWKFNLMCAIAQNYAFRSYIYGYISAILRNELINLSLRNWPFRNWWFSVCAPMMMRLPLHDWMQFHFCQREMK